MTETEEEAVAPPVVRVSPEIAAEFGMQGLADAGLVQVMPSEPEAAAVVAGDVGALPAEELAQDLASAADARADVVEAEALSEAPALAASVPFDGPEPYVPAPVEPPGPEAEPEIVQPAPVPRPELPEFHILLSGAVAKAFFEPIRNFVDEAMFRVTSDGLEAKVVDPAHVAMAHVTLRRWGTQEYRCQREGVFGLDMDKVNEIGKLVKAKESLQFDLDPSFEEGQKLRVLVAGMEQTASLVDVSGMAEPKVPRLDLPAHVVVVAKELVQVLKACERVSDHVRITVDPTEGLTILAEGDVDKVKRTWAPATLAQCRTPEKVKSLYSLEYLVNMAKAVKSEGVYLNLGTDFPLRMVWDIPCSGLEPAGSITALLAPRIES